MAMAIEDWGGTCKEMDILVEYADGRPSKKLHGVMVCRSTGLISAKSTARPEHGIKEGYNVLINGEQCKLQGVDTFEVMRTLTPTDCCIKFGKNPCGITVTEYKPRQSRLNVKEVAASIAKQHGDFVAECWEKYRSSEKAYEAEDVVAWQSLKEAGY